MNELAATPRSWHVLLDELERVLIEQFGLRSAHARASELLGEAFKLLFKSFEQRKRIGGCAGKANDDVAIGERPHLARVAFENGRPGRDLPVSSDHDFAAFAHAHDGGAVPPWLICHSADVAEHTPPIKRRLRRLRHRPPGGAAIR